MEKDCGKCKYYDFRDEECTHGIETKKCAYFASFVRGESQE